MTKLIFGCGYLGHRVAKLWQATGKEVCVVTRSVESGAAKLRDEGFQTVVADVANASTLTNLPPADTVLFAVGFDRSASNTIAEVYAGGVYNVRQALPSSVERFIYISTTGVYGPADGGWVDENTQPNPQRDGGKASLAAEQMLAENSIILRLGGIYGPGRIPYLAKLRAGEPIAAPSEGWLNLIHVDDGATIVFGSGGLDDGANGRATRFFVFAMDSRWCGETTIVRSRDILVPSRRSLLLPILHPPPPPAPPPAGESLTPSSSRN